MIIFCRRVSCYEVPRPAVRRATAVVCVLGVECFRGLSAEVPEQTYGVPPNPDAGIEDTQPRQSPGFRGGGEATFNGSRLCPREGTGGLNWWNEFSFFSPYSCYGAIETEGKGRWDLYTTKKIAVFVFNVDVRILVSFSAKGKTTTAVAKAEAAPSCGPKCIASV